MPTENEGHDAQQDPAGVTPDEGEQWKLEDLPAPVQEYIKGLRNEASQRRQALKQEQEAAAKRDQARLAEEGKWKELAEKREAELAKLSPYQQRADELERVINEGNQKRIGMIREDMKGMVPPLPPEQLASWLDANWGLLTRKPAPEIDAGAGAGSGGASTGLTEAEIAAAKKLGISPEKLLEQKKRDSK